MDIQRHDIAIQRVGTGAELPRLLEELGVPTEAVFDGSGIDPASLQPDTRVPFAALIDLIERAATLSGFPDFGLRLGLRFRMELHGPVGALMASAPTLGAALEDFETWQRGYSSGAITFVHPWGDDIALGYALCAGTLTPSPQFYHCVLGIAVRMIEELTGGAVRPVEGHVSCRASPSVQRLLKFPVRSNQPRTCLVLPGAARAFPLPGYRPAARAELSSRIAQMMQPFAPTEAARVRAALRKRLMFDRARMAEVADELGLHPRTLRRRLANEETTFEHLRDEVRFALACELLALTDMDVGEIAATLAYASPGVFSEGFRRVRGTSPTDWRRQRSAPA
ncbi:AraC family transcriptional regulator ligand-binding domain-containing protein [Palleronia sp. KMU-117]|uniref:AraC family transcriptional regulator n=1 Tax=Palleronia sp. KMU-117 TaxID=3434108 RepID=UPI003D739F7D